MSEGNHCSAHCYHIMRSYILTLNLYSQLERDLVRECPYLIPTVDILKVISFPKEFDNNQIFNDLSIQTFPKETIKKLDDKFWDSVPKVDEKKQDKE
jgi:hypothetical protein